MPTTKTPNLGILLFASGTTNWGSLHNAVTFPMLDGMAALAALAAVPADIDTTSGLSTSLRIQVNAGTYVNAAGALVAYSGTGGSPLTLAASSTKYVWLTDAGVLTTGAAFPSAGTKCVRLAVVVTGATTITSVTDARAFLTSAG